MGLVLCMWLPDNQFPKGSDLNPPRQVHFNQLGIMT